MIRTSGGKLRYDARCSRCARAGKVRRRPNRTTQGVARIRARRKLWRDKVHALLGNRCIRCGFSDTRALQIDHVNGDGWLDRRRRAAGGRTNNTNTAFYNRVLRSIRAGEGRFQLLCANCNWIKGHEEGLFGGGSPREAAQRLLDTLPRPLPLFEPIQTGAGLERAPDGAQPPTGPLWPDSGLSREEAG